MNSMCLLYKPCSTEICLLYKSCNTEICVCLQY